MWEWRAFGAEALVPAPERTRVEPVATDERTDLYLLVRGDLGLKVRSLLVSEKCELKRRYERDASGAELWEKVFEKRLPLDPLWFRELARFLDVEDRVVSPTASSRPELERLCEEAGLGRPRLVTVRKQIAKAPLPPAFTVESCELEVSCDGGAPLRVRSIAVEAPTRRLCLETGARLGFPRAGTPGVIVAGYPEALVSLLDCGPP